MVGHVCQNGHGRSLEFSIRKRKTKTIGMLIPVKIFLRNCMKKTLIRVEQKHIDIITAFDQGKNVKSFNFNFILRAF